MPERTAPSRRRRRLGAILGALTFIALTLTALAGADRPPPPGFVVVVVGTAALGVAVSRAVPWAMVRWDVAGSTDALLRVAAIGALVGVVTGLVVMVVSSGEPSIGPLPGAAVVIWLVSTALGATLGALLVVLVARAVDRRPRGG